MAEYRYQDLHPRILVSCHICPDKYGSPVLQGAVRDTSSEMGPTDVITDGETALIPIHDDQEELATRFSPSRLPASFILGDPHEIFAEPTPSRKPRRSPASFPPTDVDSDNQDERLGLPHEDTESEQQWDDQQLDDLIWPLDTDPRLIDILDDLEPSMDPTTFSLMFSDKEDVGN